MEKKSFRVWNYVYPFPTSLITNIQRLEGYIRVGIAKVFKMCIREFSHLLLKYSNQLNICLNLRNIYTNLGTDLNLTVLVE